MYTIPEEKIKKLEELVDAASRITVVTHTRPDGDAMGSATAMRSFLTSCRSKEARIVIANAYSDTLAFILTKDGAGDILQHDRDRDDTEGWISSSDLIIALDFNAFKRTDALQDILSASKAKKALIDHHLSPDEAAFDVCISETEISSASELLFWTLMSMKGIEGDASRLPEPALTALMTGMTTDTNNFANSVFPSTLEMASLLLSAGVDRDLILQNLYNSYRENRLRLMGMLLYEKMTITDDGVAYTILTKEEQQKYDLREGELEGYVNMPLGIENVRMSMFLKEDDGYFRVSIRSKRGTSANRCATLYFNGGGHEQASGGRLFIPQDIADSSLAAEYIEKKTEEFFKQI